VIAMKTFFLFCFIIVGVLSTHSQKMPGIADTLIQKDPPSKLFPPKPAASPYFITGRRISSFHARDLKGNEYQLKDLEGKIVVLNFWFIGCGPCRQEMPGLNKLADEYKDSSNIVFLAIALDPRKEVENFLSGFPFHYNIISDGRYITSMYRIYGYPTHAVLDRTGKVLFHTTGYGAGTVAWVRRMIEEGMK